MKSILQDKKECWLCGTTENLHKHHIYGGANRGISEKNGFVVWLCGWHHNLGGNGQCVHQCRDIDLTLKRACQRLFERKHSREEFMGLIGKNYLED